LVSDKMSRFLRLGCRADRNLSSMRLVKNYVQGRKGDRKTKVCRRGQVEIEKMLAFCGVNQGTKVQGCSLLFGGLC
jgi:hypothetical protein